MDIDQKAKQLEAGKKTEENEKAEDDEVVKDVEGDEEEKNRTLKPRKKRPERPKKEGAKSEEEGSTPCESSVKRKRQKKEIFPSYIDRPTRERKSIERFIASSVEKESSKDFQIKQGEGTPFKDIPNVAYKLSKISKNDEILSMLHSLLFHKRAKAAVLKQHILQFSGYVWTENQEKERSRVKEKLERYTKEGLVLLIDVLDLHLPRTGKKEELVGKVLEFLEKPHKTTDVLLEEKEQEKQLKNARKRSSGKGTLGRSPKKHKVDGESSTKRGRRKPAEESDLGESAKSEDDDALEEEEETEKKHFTFKDEDHEEDSDSDTEEEKKKKSAKKLSRPSSKKDSKPETEVSSDYKEKERSEAEEMPPKKSMTKTPAKLSTPESSPKASSKPVEKVYSKNARKQNKQKETEKEKEKVKEKEKQKEERKEKEKEKGNKVKEKKGKELPKLGRGRPKKSDVILGKSDGVSSKSTISAAEDNDPAQREKSYMVKESKPRKSKNVPSDEQLQSEIRALLIDADFSKVTFTDVITQLEGKFGVSLTEHKTHVKKLIKEEISKLADKEDDEPETEVGAGSQAEAEGEAEPRADAEAECEPAPEAVAELKATKEQKSEPKQEERSEIQAEAEVEAKASPRGEAEVSQQVAPEVKTDVTEEVEDMVLEPGTTQKPGPEPTPTVVADTKENAQLDLGTELELKTAANETERI
ncbi:hypothetical protein BDL97_03G082300 [Sphagnum fallax]|nr:hypothetical protein BDL97_03G082300 [Sphagnum fallax]KAH8967550.1 hypothetical protein BDL97_03G082300 [Sphagnum fallax]KAH8967551.1 hypothetical protein BDL97_03G082300 [Sphagnum fallax]